MDFLKKHFEKILLCLVLIGLAAAMYLMKGAIDKAQAATSEPIPGQSQVSGRPGRGGSKGGAATVAPLDLKVEEAALAQITNPPPMTLSGEHNLFNPVTWKRKPNGDLLKVIKTGADALTVTNIIPLYTIISYDHPSGGAPIYIMTCQSNVDLQNPGKGKRLEYAKKDEKNKSGVYIVRGIKGAEDDPSEINLEITATGDTNVWVSTNTPYKYVDSHVADLKYDPDAQVLRNKRVNDELKLDSELYKIVEITNDAVRVRSNRTTKVKEIKWTKSQKGD